MMSDLGHRFLSLYSLLGKEGGLMMLLSSKGAGILLSGSEYLAVYNRYLTLHAN